MTEELAMIRHLTFETQFSTWPGSEQENTYGHRIKPGKPPSAARRRARAGHRANSFTVQAAITRAYARKRRPSPVWALAPIGKSLSRGRSRSRPLRG